MKTRKINKLLVANRGEIAIRVMRTAKEMGIKTVAVFSDVDRLSPHTKYADEAYHIGESPSSKSYLVIDKIIEVAKLANVDAIHPGYGFLSENAGFAKRVSNEGIIFIGPSPQAIEVMGSKLAAKEAVSKYDIPLVPGTEEAVTDVNKAIEVAKTIGFPILIKASAGGGGKGMRIVEKESELEEQMQRAISEAESAFGDGSVFIEKYITSPKHIEVQVIADKHGNYVHLFERECSIQRRHQKVIEEAPSPVVDEGMRKKIGESAIMVAKACSYQNAGTVEFIVDNKLNYYFLEMNTRLQVEHPVTEMITGVDLVKEQIHIAEGKKLSFSQDDLVIRNHAIEVRVYAEDPKNDFLPDIGTLKTYKKPDGNGVRVDDGYEQGMEIPIFYDPMISKLIAYGKDRNEAIAKLIRAIDEYEITGVSTTLEFCKFVLGHNSFIDGSFDTNFVNQFFTPEKLDEMDSDDEDIKKMLAASLSAYLYENKIGLSSTNATLVKAKQKSSKWKSRAR